METIVESFAKTLELLLVLVTSGAEAAYKKVKPQARLYFKSLLVTALVGLALVPALALAKMVTGVVVFAYAAALLAIIFTLILGLLWSPLGVIMGMLAENTLNPIVAGERFVRFVAAVLFVELMISGYIIRVPTHQNLEAVPLLIMAATAVGLGTFVWGGWFSGRFYTFVAAVIMTLTTLSFFMPTAFYALTQKLQVADTEIAEALGYRDPDIIYSKDDKIQVDLREKIKIPLAANTWSKEIYLPTADYLFYTPGEWLEYKKRDGVNEQNIAVRVDAMNADPIKSNGEYFRFRTDISAVISVAPIQYRK